MKAGFVKIEPTSQAEVFKQPIFNNPLVTSFANWPLGMSGLSERWAIVKVGCTRIRDLCDHADREWKSLLALEMTSHITNQINKDIIISSNPWNMDAFPNGFKIGDWINIKAMSHLAPLTWIYRMVEVFPNLVKAIEFRKISPSGFMRIVSSQEVTLSPACYHLVKVLSQKTWNSL